MMHRSTTVLILLFASAGALHCNEAKKAAEQTEQAARQAAETVSNTVTCAQVCNRYRTCFDDKLDMVNCTKRCEGAARDEQQEKRLETCHDCMDDGSCAKGAFNCKTQCEGVVP